MLALINRSTFTVLAIEELGSDQTEVNSISPKHSSNIQAMRDAALERPVMPSRPTRRDEAGPARTCPNVVRRGRCWGSSGHLWRLRMEVAVRSPCCSARSGRGRPRAVKKSD